VDPGDLNLPGAFSEPQVITHLKFRIWLREDGIVQLVWVPGVSVGSDDVVAAAEAASALAGGRKYPLLVDARGGGPPDRRARSELARQGKGVPAVAMIVDTPLSRMMGNFVIVVNKPVAPTRLFADEGSAVAWLTGFLS
jgi:hypothetical protein